MLLWYGSILSGVVALLRSSRLLQRLYVDGVTGELRASEKGLFGLVARDVRLPTSRITRLELRLLSSESNPDIAPAFSDRVPVLPIQLSWWSNGFVTSKSKARRRGESRDAALDTFDLGATGH